MNTIMVKLKPCSLSWTHAHTVFFQEAFIAWWPIVFFPADVGNFNKGFTATIILGALVTVTVAGIWALETKTR